MPETYHLTYRIKHDPDIRKTISAYNFLSTSEDRENASFLEKEYLYSSVKLKNEHNLLPLVVSEFFSVLKNIIQNKNITNSSVHFCASDILATYSFVEPKKYKIADSKVFIKSFILHLSNCFCSGEIPDKLQKTVYYLLHISDKIAKERKYEIFLNEIQSLIAICKKRNIQLIIDESVRYSKFHLNLQQCLENFSFEYKEEVVLYSNEKEQQFKKIQEKRLSLEEEEKTVVYNVYTDASISNDLAKIGFGAVIQEEHNSNKTILELYGMNFSDIVNYSTQYGEMLAILKSVEVVHKLILSRKENGLIRIHTDNKDCESILYGAIACPIELKELKFKINSIDVRKMFSYVKAHIVDTPNDRADKLAKKGRKLQKEKTIVFKKMLKNKKKIKN